MVQRGEAVDGVVAGERRSRGGAESRQRPAVVGDLLGHQFAAADRVEDDEGDVAGIARVGPVPAGQFHGVRVDLLHVDDVAADGQSQIAVLAAAEHQHLDRKRFGRSKIRRIGDDVGDTAEAKHLVEVGIVWHQHGDGAEPGQRGDGDERAGPGVHQDPDPGALADADVDQATHDVVDAPVDCFVGVHPSVEQQELTAGCRLGLLIDDARQRDPGVVIDLA